MRNNPGPRQKAKILFSTQFLFSWISKDMNEIKEIATKQM